MRLSQERVAPLEVNWRDFGVYVIQASLRSQVPYETSKIFSDLKDLNKVVVIRLTNSMQRFMFHDSFASFLFATGPTGLGIMKPGG